MQQCICQVFKSHKKAGAYLYVEKSQGISQVPAALLNLLGDCKPAMVLLLQANKKLAAVNVQDVLQAIAEKGFYLQMATAEDEQMQAIAKLNNKLSL